MIITIPFDKVTRQKIKSNCTKRMAAKDPMECFVGNLLLSVLEATEEKVV